MRKLTNNSAPLRGNKPHCENLTPRPFTGRRMKRPLAVGLLVFLLSFAGAALAQRGGGSTLFGDFKVDESQDGGLKPLSFDLILYTSGGRSLAVRKSPVMGGIALGTCPTGSTIWSSRWRTAKSRVFTFC